MQEIRFENYTPDFTALKAEGFTKRTDGYFKTVPIIEGQFFLNLTVSENGTVRTKLIDAMTEDEYVLHLVPTAGGAFVGEVRAEYDRAVERLKQICFRPDVYRYPQTQIVFEHIHSKYGVEPEHLWEKYPEDAIFRRKDTKKWFALLMTIDRKKLGLKESGTTEILTIRMYPDELSALVDGEMYFAGYHMNKKHWLTVLLDGSLSERELFERIEFSYGLAK